MGDPDRDIIKQQMQKGYVDLNTHSRQAILAVVTPVGMPYCTPCVCLVHSHLAGSYPQQVAKLYRKRKEDKQGKQTK
jgi:hypothetical protein